MSERPVDRYPDCVQTLHDLFIEVTGESTVTEAQHVDTHGATTTANEDDYGPLVTGLRETGLADAIGTFDGDGFEW
ncbi:MAG: hypothetical protein ABEJ28_05990 [Salinigranum sp.]